MNALKLGKVIKDILIQHHSVADSIISEHGLVFTSRFWYSICYFLTITRQFLIAFDLPTDGQIERENSITEAYL